jgi:hypothetical protein
MISWNLNTFTIQFAPLRAALPEGRILMASTVVLCLRVLCRDELRLPSSSSRRHRCDHANGENHGVAEKIVVAEARLAGYELLECYGFVTSDGVDYFLVFEIEWFLQGLPLYFFQLNLLIRGESSI